MPATLKEVAARAGVSTATASMVLSRRPDHRVSEATADRVRWAAKELNYRGNRAARSLRLQTTRVLGMLGQGVATRPYAVRMLLGAQLTARRFDYDLLYLEIPEDDEEAIVANLLLLEDHQVAGVLIASYFHRPLTLPPDLPKALVLMDATSDRLDVDSVVPDEYASERALLAELARAGHRKVGWICEDTRSPASRLRSEAFRDAAAQHGWDDNPARVVLVKGNNSRSGFEAMERMLVSYPEVTAVACYTDRMAMGAYSCCQESGLRVPHDMSIVGFDDQRLISEGLRPQLTTVGLPHREMGEWAVMRLLDRIRATDDQVPTQHLIAGNVVVRGSVGPPRDRRR